MSEVNVVDNFLKKEDYEQLREILESNNFPWYFQLYTAVKTDDIFNYQFIHLFYKNYVPNSEYFYILKPLIKQINPISLIRV